MRTIACLFVDPDGAYSRAKHVDLWDADRDARDYQGPHAVVAHPPNARWGKFWRGSPRNPRPKKLGNDGGCFASALWAVRTFGGVIEHPCGSHAWPWNGLPSSRLWGWWSDPDQYGGRSCQVDQGVYGHPCPKSTWLYACLPEYPELDWSKSAGGRRVELQSKKQRIQTSPCFRDLLLGLARSVGRDA